MNSLSYEEIIETGFTPKGTPLIPISKLEECLPKFWKDRFFVHSMEAYAVSEKFDTPIIELGICGLDREENWEEHRDVKIAEALVKRRLDGSRNMNRNIHYKLWLDDWP